MFRTDLSAQRLLDAPADVVYRCIADYERHHRPGGFLPTAFSDFQIERGGVGAGTIMSFTVTLAGRSRRMTHEVSEPEPGRVLVEGGSRERTRFIVDPIGLTQCQVTIETTIVAGGLDGLLTKLLGARLMQPLYQDELARLERRAQEQLAAPA
jgi:hypothetical protein